MKGGEYTSRADTLMMNDFGGLNTSTDSMGNVSNQSGASTASSSGGNTHGTAGDQNTQLYNGLLHSQYLYDAIYHDENSY